MKTERETNQENRLLTIESKLMGNRGEAGGGMGKIGDGNWECTCCDEHWVIYGSAESLYCTPESNIILTLKKIMKKKQGNIEK